MAIAFSSRIVILKSLTINTRKADVYIFQKYCKRQLHRHCSFHPLVNHSNKWHSSVGRKRLSIIQRFASGTSGGVISNTTENASSEPLTPLTTAIPESPLDKIPDAPAIPSLPDIVDTFSASGIEPSFQSLDLGCWWTPVGIVQNCMEYLHVTCNLPWWTAIAIGTVVVRSLVFPVFIIAQRNAAKMNNCLPQMQIIQLKITEARQTGNNLEVARLSQELMAFMNSKGINPFKNMIVPMSQAPLFVSFFMGLRDMANVPVESLKSGGLFWFTDLTVPDQYYLLPIFTSMSLWITIEIGAEGAKLNQTSHVMKYVLRGLPLIILPFTVNFPGAILCYWATSNVITLLQVALIRVPAVREFFKIEKMVHHPPSSLPIKAQPFVKGIKESWSNIKLARDIEDRRLIGQVQFQRAGRAPIVKTYKYDPTKPQPQQDLSNVSAKQRDS